MISRRKILAFTLAAPLAHGSRALTQEAPANTPVPGLARDQSAALQAALDDAARTGRGLHLARGVYRTGPLRVPDGTTLTGAAGAVLESTGSGPVLILDSPEYVRISGLGFRGRNQKPSGGLVEVANCPMLVLEGCTFTGSGGNALTLFRSGGRIYANRFSGCRSAAISSHDATGLAITDNRIEQCNKLGIYIARYDPGPDGTIVRGNRIDNIGWTDGGNGQNGNGINAYRTDGIIIEGNVIGNCAFSAIRLNATRNAIVSSNLCTNLQEVAIFSEFGFSGSVISDNVIDWAAQGIAITNLDTGGRLASCSGNIVRNIRASSPTNPDTAPVGIAAEADTTVNSNIIDNVPGVGLALGWGPYLRNVSATGNVVRDCAIGIGISVVEGVGTTLVANNLVTPAKGGLGLAGMEWDTVTDPGLAAGRYPWLTLSGNTVRPAG